MEKAVRLPRQRAERSPIHAIGDCRKEMFMDDFSGIVGSTAALLTDVAHSTTDGLASARSAVEDAMGGARGGLL